MNETDTKKFKKMQDLARTAPLSEMERWLIARPEAEAAEVGRLLAYVDGNDKDNQLEAAESDAARQRERADRAEALNAELRRICGDLGEAATDPAQLRRIEALEKAAVLLALPYEGLLADSESRRWIAPGLWAAIEEGVVAFRALLSPAPSTEPSAETKEKVK